VNLLAISSQASSARSWFHLPDGGLHLLVEHVENAGAMRDWIARRELQNIDQLYLPRIGSAARFIFAIDDQSPSGQVITEATALASVSNEAELRRAMRGSAREVLHTI